MEQAKAKRIIKWLQLIGGVAVVTFALVSGGADIFNNCKFGFQQSAPIAVAFALAGVGLMLFPAMAEGWHDVQVWFLVAACAGLSVFAGYQNHMTAQRNAVLAEAGVTMRYDEARRAIQAAETAYNDAKGEAAAISETMGSAELLQLVSDKRDTVKSECAVRGNKCRKAEGDAESYVARLAGAKAREEAQERATKALQRMETEKARAPVQAKAASSTETQELLMAIGLLALTICGATFTHRGANYIRDAIVIETIKPARLAKPKPETIVQPAEEKRHDVEAFLGYCTEASDGPPLAAAAFHKSLCSYWALHNPGQPVPTPVMLGRALGKRYTKVKAKGKQCYLARVTNWSVKALEVVQVAA